VEFIVKIKRRKKVKSGGNTADQSERIKIPSKTASVIARGFSLRYLAKKLDIFR
jgi:hypothetical protein